LGAIAMNDDEVIERFLDEICNFFPEIKTLIESHDECMTTSMMEEFSNATTIAFSEGNIELAKSYLSYINNKLVAAHPKELEFIDVYYVENLFWNANLATKRVGWPLVPAKLQKLYFEFHGKPAL
jgi:hypothetical protein